MSRARWKPFLAATLFAVAIFAAGCAADDKPPPPAPDAGPQPKLLSDLSTVSDAPINPFAAVQPAPARGEGLLHDPALTRLLPGRARIRPIPASRAWLATRPIPARCACSTPRPHKFGEFLGGDSRSHLRKPDRGRAQRGNFANQAAHRNQGRRHHRDHGQKRQAHRTHSRATFGQGENRSDDARTSARRASGTRILPPRRFPTTAPTS